MRKMLTAKRLALTSAIGVVSIVSALAQVGSTWNWDAGVCPNNTNWYGYCSTGGPCPGDITRPYYVNNWRVYACSVSDLRYPAAGAVVAIPRGLVTLWSSVDVKQITLAPSATMQWLGGTITLRNPANNNAPGEFLIQRLLSVEGGSAYNYWSGLLRNTGTLVLNKSGGHDLRASA